MSDKFVSGNKRDLVSMMKFINFLKKIDLCDSEDNYSFYLSTRALGDDGEIRW